MGASCVVTHVGPVVMRPEDNGILHPRVCPMWSLPLADLLTVSLPCNKL